MENSKLDLEDVKESDAEDELNKPAGDGGTNKQNPYPQWLQILKWDSCFKERDSEADWGDGSQCQNHHFLVLWFVDELKKKKLILKKNNGACLSEVGEELYYHFWHPLLVGILFECQKNQGDKQANSEGIDRYPQSLLIIIPVPPVEKGEVDYLKSTQNEVHNCHTSFEVQVE